MFRKSLLMMAALSLAVWCGAALAADAAAGKVKADDACGDCHDVADWQGEDAAAIEAMIREVASGAVKHKAKISLSDAEIANIAAYWAGG